MWTKLTEQVLEWQGRNKRGRQGPDIRGPGAGLEFHLSVMRSNCRAGNDSVFGASSSAAVKAPASPPSHPPTSLWKNCLSQDQSLVSKRFGDCCSRWYGIHLQPSHMISGYRGQTHLTKCYLSLLFLPSSGFPWGLSILLVIFKGSTPSFTDHPYNFFFL